MSLEEKIEAAYIEAVKVNRDVCNQTSFSVGYMAAIEDIKKNGPVAFHFRDDPACIAMPGSGFSYKYPDEALDIVPLYRLED